MNDPGESRVAPPAAGPPAMEPKALRKVFSHYPTGVSIVTGLGGDGQPVGLVVGTFSSVSLDPPLVTFYPMKTSRAFAEIRDHGAFVVNVVGSREDYYCQAFSREPERRFDGIDWTPGHSGAPVLANSAAWIDCAIERVEEVGDHYWVLGRVVALDIGTSTTPLVFVKGAFGSTAALADERVRWYVDMTEEL
ncbi:flavin reductase family protein [Streptomyces sp. NPDC046909]|uniref:flavin reductase family protein n=1 Tax=Streptomyces sp. NPDC046909 TaxID=3155617 RepID=UPI0033FC3814